MRVRAFTKAATLAGPGPAVAEPPTTTPRRCWRAAGPWPSWGAAGLGASALYRRRRGAGDARG
ncbi:hypothetical protein [Actinomadura kijaniata]|uniref:hypothetical protein n=1 Tax=Actinomadura kijaniata TaxID=46161 RepID=UPI0012FB8C2B|nr:hypothetical protein [Actinomadura kijaniata]